MSGSKFDDFYNNPPSNIETFLKNLAQSKVPENKKSYKNLKYSSLMLKSPVKQPVYSSLDLEQRFPELKTTK